MYRAYQTRLKKIISAKAEKLFGCGLKGIEKESLRVAREGFIAQSPHPQALGSALTHPYITTDYSEALLELITPPFRASLDTLAFLRQLHQFIYANIGDEMLWCASMPCIVSGDESIPIARYGTSNVGRMKHIYRVGLGYRYGRAMQAIAGVHFNYSVLRQTWPVFKELEQSDRPLEQFISTSYFNLIRNFLRLGWLVPLLFGCSPAVCKSFGDLRERDLDEWDEHTYYKPFATSLRMSDIGYKNANQAALKISYNNLEEYAETLLNVVETPYPPYEEIGVVVDGEYRQLNANILQIENEYYSFIRPKQIVYSGEKPVRALQRRGVEYVEVRALDVCAFDDIGVNEAQLRFLEAFLLFCLLNDSPYIDAEEKAAIESNQNVVARAGRDPLARLKRNGRLLPVGDWALEICGEMQGICEILDRTEGGEPLYTVTLAQQMEKLRHLERLPSARMLEDMRENNLSFFEFALAQSKLHEKTIKATAMDIQHERYFRDLAEQSINEQHALEQNGHSAFSDYLRDYFAQ